MAKSAKRSARVEGVFEHPNMEGFCCPICGGKEDRPVVLARIMGTEKGNICEAEQVHADCLLKSVVYYKDLGLFVKRLGGKND